MAAEADVPLPSPPFLSIPGLPNFRDAGGYPISPSTNTTGTTGKPQIIRRNTIFRASEPSKLTPAGVTALQDLGIAKVYDLRSAVEIARGGAGGDENQGFAVREWEGAERVFVPVFLDLDYSPEMLALRYRNYTVERDEGFIQAYADILAAASDPSNTYQPFRTILSHLASASSPSSTASTSTATPTPGPSPCLIHCTAGKDRTGVVVALVLSLCGVPDDVVAHEYALTDIGLRERWPELVAHLTANPKLAIDAAGARRMIGARKGAMIGTLAQVREKHGSVEKCVIDLGLLSPEEITQLRKNLIVEAEEEDVIQWKEHAKLLL
ncbi:Uu.00g109990.m01.CDS01 [Anthostomella pinea]|uniref:Uu.00g109990.m01.CDS01 n=1 Tax=Anthostomella pinea TaxID=933095 RepID=A0AAI8VFA9_9PEZI|nr:Uu.00g109990.m01.CDS01 [Anthostomella pinea]